MDFLMELIMGILFEAPIEATMESKRVKTWIKTTLFVVLGSVVEALFLFLAYMSCFVDKEPVLTIIALALVVGWLIVIIYGAIHGHKHKWKQSI